MEINRTKNASRNIFSGVLLKIYNIGMPFLMRTVIIYTLGIQYLGLSSLFTSVLQVLNLAELGVGGAMVYSMYRPIVEDDTYTICALLKLYKKYYRIISLVILTTGLVLTPFLKYLVKADTLPNDINLYCLYFMYLVATVSSYSFLAYKKSILSAFQRTDIDNKVTIIVSTVAYALQIVSLYCVKNYYLYTVIFVVSNIVNNAVTSFVVNKMYPEYKPVGDIAEEEKKAINKRVKDLFTARLGGTITGSADTIVISAFLGLSVLAIYQNYYFIMISVISFVLVIFNSTTAGIGNSLVIESAEKNYLDFRKFSFLINWISIVVISCFICLFQPFINLWVGEKYILEYPFVILFCVYYYVFVVQQLACVYKDAGGIWHQDRWRPLIAGMVNLCLNLIFVQKFGLYAILLSTIVSYIFVAMPWLIYNLFKIIFDRSFKEYVVFIIAGFVLSFLVGGVCYFICSFISITPVVDLLLKFIVSFLLSNILVIVLYRKHYLYNKSLELIDGVLGYKMHIFISLIKTKEIEE